MRFKLPLCISRRPRTYYNIYINKGCYCERASTWAPRLPRIRPPAICIHPSLIPRDAPEVRVGKKQNCTVANSRARRVSENRSWPCASRDLDSSRLPAFSFSFCYTFLAVSHIISLLYIYFRPFPSTTRRTDARPAALSIFRRSIKKYWWITFLSFMFVNLVFKSYGSSHKK